MASKQSVIDGIQASKTIKKAQKVYMMTALEGESPKGWIKTLAYHHIFLRIDNAYMMRNALYGE